MRKDIIKVLHDMQKWRRGGGKMPHSPKAFGLAIDMCIRMLRKMSDEEVMGKLYEKKEVHGIE